MSEQDLAIRARLPAAVYDLAIRSGATLEAPGGGVRLTQTGRMKPRLGSRTWLPFTATQTISTRACDFDWRATFGPLGVIRVRDALCRGEGRLDVRALGILPIAHVASTPALARGELMRYLAELPWVPDAIFHNEGLRWRDDGGGLLTVSAGEGVTAASVRLNLDGQGRIAGAFAPDRPRSVGKTGVPTAWTGRFSDYRRHEGRWIPVAGEVAWDVDGVPEVYWQGDVRSWTRV